MDRLERAALIDRIRSLAEIGLTSGQIAEELHITRNSVIGFCRRAQIQLRGPRNVPGIPNDPKKRKAGGCVIESRQPGNSGGGTLHSIRARKRAFVAMADATMRRCWRRSITSHCSILSRIIAGFLSAMSAHRDSAFAARRAPATKHLTANTITR